MRAMTLGLGIEQQQSDDGSDAGGRQRGKNCDGVNVASYNMPSTI